MASPFVAEIRMFGFNFAPTGWATCDGQLMPISQNTALFSLLGTYYGGDGKSTFALPNLDASCATHQGQGPGLQEWFLGQMQGSESITLLQTEMPAHQHFFMATSVNGTNQTAAGGQLAKGFKGNIQASQTAKVYSATASPNPITQMSPQALAVAGSSLPHNNMMPYLTVSFCIALQGVFPPRT
jgi:microcystin-dependent protein